MSKRNKTNGFTLIETLVAITVLLLVVIGPITVAQKGIRSAYYANEQVTAVFLAQEAIEAIRELRDANALEVYVGSGDTWSWYGTLASICDADDDCAYNPTEVYPFEDCGVGNSNCGLNIDSDTNEYTHESGGQPSGFERRVRIRPVSNGGIPVQVEVSWTSRTFGGTNPPVILNTWIYDHYQRYENF